MCMMRKEAASLRWKLNPKNFGSNIKSIKFLGLGVKTRVGRVSGDNKFLGLNRHYSFSGLLTVILEPSHKNTLL